MNTGVRDPRVPAGDPVGVFRVARVDHALFELSLARDGGIHRVDLDLDVPCLAGLSPGEPFLFDVRREAGTLALAGRAGPDGSAGGKVYFAPDEGFRRELERRGIRRRSNARLLLFAVHDAGPRLAAGLRDEGLGSLPIETVLQLAMYRVTPELVARLRRAGYPSLTPDDLVKVQIYGVTAELIGEFAEVGLHELTIGQLVELRIMDVTPSFAGAMLAAADHPLSVRELVSLRMTRS